MAGADRSVNVRITADAGPFIAGLARAKAASSAFARSLDNSLTVGSSRFSAFQKQLDTSNDRMSFLVQTTLALTPALVPLGAVAVGGLAMLTSGLVSAAGAGTAAVFAFQGIGDGLDAINKYQLDPTAANLDNLTEKLGELGPAALEFTLFLDELGPQLDALQDVAAEEMFPGLQAGLEDVITQMPVFTRILAEFSEGVGQLGAEAGQALTGPFWTDFFEFIEGDAKDDLVVFGRALGNFVEGFAAMFQAFDPLADEFADGMLGISRSFSEWAQGLDESQGFQEFVDYIRQSGPQVGEALSAITDAVVSLLQAFSTFSGPALQVVETIADVISALASSPAGPALLALAAALSAVSRAMALFKVVQGSALLGQFTVLGKSAQSTGKHVAGVGTSAAKANIGLGGLAAGVGALALSFTDLDERAGVSNTLTFGLLGALAGPWGAAIGATAGAVIDAGSAFDDFGAAAERLEGTMASDPLDFDAQNAALAQMRAEFAATEADLESFWGSMSPAGQKNFWEGVFGSSDVEENRAKLEDYTDSLAEHQNQMRDVIDVTEGAQPAMDALGISFEELAAARQKIDSESFLTSVVGVAEWASLTGQINEYTKNAGTAQGRSMLLGEALAEVSDAEGDAAAEAVSLNAALEMLFSTMDREAAVDALIASTRALSKELSDGTHTFEGNSAAALENRETTRAWAADLKGALIEIANAGGKDVAGRLVDRLNEGRAAFIAEGQAAGFSAKQMMARADVIGLTPKQVVSVLVEKGWDEGVAKAKVLAAEYKALPKKVRTDIDANGVSANATVESLMRKYEGLSRYQAETILRARDAASPTVAELMRKYEGLSRADAETLLKAIDDASPVISRVLGLLSQVQDKSVTVTTTYTQIGRPPSSTALAEGGTLDFYGRGGTRERHVAQIAPAGAMRVWAEPETGGEAYIPFAREKRGRSLDIWAEAGRRLGVSGYAGGGVNAKDTDPGLEENEILRALAPILKAFGKNSPITEAIDAWLQGVKESNYSAAERSERVEKALDRNTNNALKAFRIGDRSSKDDVKSEVQELLAAMKELLGKDSPVVARMTAMGDQLIAEADARDELRESIQDLRDTNRELVQAQRDYAQTVAGSLTNDPFQGSLHDFDVQTSADTNDARKVLRALKIAKRHGLDGPLFRELAASGNVALILEFAQLSRKGIERREDLFESQRRAAKAVGAFAGDEVFGEQIAENSKELRQATRELHRLNKRIDNLENAVERGSEKGTRRGSRDGTRDGHRDAAKGRQLASKSGGVWIGRNPPR